jgi:purine-nucleoside phosphorylase
LRDEIGPAERNAARIFALSARSPRAAIVLGSGLGGLTEDLEEAMTVPYAELEGFPTPTVSGHAGALHLGCLAGLPVAVLAGRGHYYERGDPAAMRLALETVRALGCDTIILTNAAGSLRENIAPGSVMLIADHINFGNRNPLIGEASEARFVGMTQAYDVALRQAATEAAAAEGVTLPEGVYLWFSGPSFETPAEIRAAAVLGADAVGMSTVPEVILARFLGLRVLAFSVVTNYAAGMTGAELSHEETKAVAPQGGETLRRILKRLAARLPQM